MLSPDHHIGIFAALLGLSATAFWLEKTRLGGLLTGTVLVILMAIAAANIGVIPHQARAYDFVFQYLVPVLIPLFLLQGDMRRLIKEASRTTLAFLIASLGTVLGVLLAVWLLDLSALAGGAAIDPARKSGAVAGLFSATYIGGSVNYAALGEIRGCVIFLGGYGGRQSFQRTFFEPARSTTGSSLARFTLRLSRARRS